MVFTCPFARTSTARSWDHRAQRRPGRGPIELVVVAALVGAFLLLAMVAMPRWRESSRLVHCVNNLRRVGVGVELYQQSARKLPTVPPLHADAGESPLRTMLDTLALPDFLELSGPKPPPKPTRGPVPGSRLPGLFCPSDPTVRSSEFAALVSYRANTGDRVDGGNGPFSPGRAVNAREVEDADGLAFTAGFGERLVGNGRDSSPTMENYAIGVGPMAGSGCPDAAVEQYRGDAGSSWTEASWRSTLYNHAQVPNAPRSCIAVDGQTSTMGASSAHANRVNVLMLDGSVRGVTPTISPGVWRAMATTGQVAPDPSPPR